jgi:hypothetical protein
MINLPHVLNLNKNWFHMECIHYKPAGKVLYDDCIQFFLGWVLKNSCINGVTKRKSKC